MPDMKLTEDNPTVEKLMLMGMFFEMSLVHVSAAIDVIEECIRNKRVQDIEIEEEFCAHLEIELQAYKDKKVRIEEGLYHLDRVAELIGITF